MRTASERALLKSNTNASVSLFGRPAAIRIVQRPSSRVLYTDVTWDVLTSGDSKARSGVGEHILRDGNIDADGDGFVGGYGL